MSDLLDQCSCLDAAMERQALMNGSVFEPVFPENEPFKNWKRPVEDGGGWHMTKDEKNEILGGTKYDDGKPDFSLLPPEALEGAAGVFKMGSDKYGRGNWQRGLSYSRIFAACMRHLWSWWRGEENDPESGLSHLHHAACNIMMLQWYVANNKGKDDRL